MRPCLRAVHQYCNANYMTDGRVERSTRDWRNYLTPEERREIARIDRQIAKLGQQATTLRTERNRIQNRATVRAIRDSDASGA